MVPFTVGGQRKIILHNNLDAKICGTYVFISQEVFLWRDKRILEINNILNMYQNCIFQKYKLFGMDTFTLLSRYNIDLLMSLMLP